MSVLEGVTIGSSVFQPKVDDKDITDSHTFSVSYSPPEGTIYLDVSKTGKFYYFYMKNTKAFRYILSS